MTDLQPFQLLSFCKQVVHTKRYAIKNIFIIILLKYCYQNIFLNSNISINSYFIQFECTFLNSTSKLNGPIKENSIFDHFY